MKEIELKEGFAFIYLNKEIYDKKLILSSLSDYVDFLNFLVMENNQYTIIKISLKDSEYELSHLANEFLNYVLGNHYLVKSS